MTTAQEAARERQPVLVACEMSGAVRSRLRARGVNAWSLDVVPALDAQVHHLQEPLTQHVLGLGWAAVIAFPPCTHLAASGARWWPAKVSDGRQAAAAGFVRMIADAPVPRIAIENPVGALSRLWRKPDQIIQPWHHGHGETKATCLWLKGLPLLAPTDVVDGRRPATWLTPGGPHQATRRSMTYTGIARAMADQWGPCITAPGPHREEEIPA
jgi:hypothetical protein